MNKTFYSYIIGTFVLVEKTSKELIKNTLNLNESFEMDYNEKYSKCDLIKNTKNNDKLKLKK
jgi:hypothetical protein